MEERFLKILIIELKNVELPSKQDCSIDWPVVMFIAFLFCFYVTNIVLLAFYSSWILLCSDDWRRLQRCFTANRS